MKKYLTNRSLANLRCKFSRAAVIAKNQNRLMSSFDSLFDQYKDERALALKLMMLTGLRVGNIESALGYQTKVHPMLQKKGVKSVFRQTFGLTTLEKRHVHLRKGKIVFDFLGKKGVQQKVVIEDKKTVDQCRVQLKKKGETFLGVHDCCLRKFVKKTLGDRFTVKDFRTYFANLVATEEILRYEGVPKKLERTVCVAVASKLGNTPSISKKAYIDPKIFTNF